jgi:hypothetical protein
MTNDERNPKRRRAAHSKTWRKIERLWPTRQRLGVRRSYAAFEESTRSELIRFMESPLGVATVHWDLERVGRVTPCAPQFGNAQTARRGLTRPTFRFMESPLGVATVHWDLETRGVARPPESADKSDALQTLRALRRRPAVAKRLECARLQRRFPKTCGDSMAAKAMFVAQTALSAV